MLDYQLDRTRPGDGSTAISIVRKLMSNDHFNLVVIHTSENLETVFRETLLLRLLESKGAARQWLVADSVNRHSEQLMGGLLPRVEKFASRLIEAETGAGAALDISNERFGVNLGNPQEQLKAVREHNAYVSSKPPEGWHLTTGHIFEVANDYWVCVSPACDTVPGQLSAVRVAAFGKRLPFMAVKLIPVADTKQVSDVQTNRYLFVKLDGVVKAFCFNDPSSDLSAPAWHTLFADKRGEFQKHFTFNVFVAEKGSRGMVQRRHSARVVAQLRYEYALNFVQRLGGTFTRIGLNYV